MTLFDLQKEIDKWIYDGYGEKTIYMEGMPEQGNWEINSVQQNTNPEIEPDYLFIMGGGEAI